MDPSTSIRHCYFAIRNPLATTILDVVRSCPSGSSLANISSADENDYITSLPCKTVAEICIFCSTAAHMNFVLAPDNLMAANGPDCVIKTVGSSSFDQIPCSGSAENYSVLCEIESTYYVPPVGLYYDLFIYLSSLHAVEHLCTPSPLTCDAHVVDEYFSICACCAPLERFSH